MPRIVLKHKSPEYADPKESVRTQPCDMPGCSENAEHKAPKHRGLNEHYCFCYAHVSEYNKAWDFFSGMQQHEVQDHILNSIYGDRPTWRYAGEDATENLRRAAEKTYNFGQSDSRKQENRTESSMNTNTPEYEALAIMGLEPPVTLDVIKARYKTLAKKHHPDLNKNNPKSEELLKRINMAYTILKLAFEEYKNLPERP